MFHRIRGTGMSISFDNPRSISMNGIRELLGSVQKRCGFPVRKFVKQASLSGGSAI